MVNYKKVITQADIAAFRSLIDKTRSCINAKGGMGISFEEKLACELALFSDGNSYTYHTHPNGSEEPSDQDRITTNRFKKRFMFIGLVPQREVIVYHNQDNFITPLGKFKV